MCGTVNTLQLQVCLGHQQRLGTNLELGSNVDDIDLYYMKPMSKKVYSRTEWEI